MLMLSGSRTASSDCRPCSVKTNPASENRALVFEVFSGLIDRLIDSKACINWKTYKRVRIVWCVISIIRSDETLRGKYVSRVQHSITLIIKYLHSIVGINLSISENLIATNYYER